MSEQFDYFEHDFAQAASTTYDADGFLLVGLDSAGTGEAPTEQHWPYGFMARPMDPAVDANGAPTSGCTVHTWAVGSTKHAMCLGDPRDLSNIPQIGKGDSCQYSASGAFVKCHGSGVNAGRISAGTKDANGADMGWTLDPGGGHTVFGQFGRQFFDMTGWHLQTYAGPSIDIGGAYGLPAPASAFGAYMRFRAANVQVLAPIIMLGAKGSTARSPVALATPLATVLAAVLTAVQALQQAVTQLATPQAVAGAATVPSPPVVAAAAAVSSAVSALAAATAPVNGAPSYFSATTLSS